MPIPEFASPVLEGARSSELAREYAWRDASVYAERRRAGAHVTAPLERRDTRASWYPGAVRSVEKINEDAMAQDYPTVEEATKTAAVRLLLAMSRVPWDPAIYPSMDGEIAIYFKSSRSTAALLILLDNSRRAACYWSTDAENTYKRYEDVSMLPDEFLNAKIRTLTRPALLQADSEFIGPYLV